MQPAPADAGLVCSFKYARNLREVQASDWFALAALCVCGTLSHYFLIRAYGLLPAAEVQPVTYFQLVLNVVIAVILFGEVITLNKIIGAAIVVGAGLFTIWREYHLTKRS